MRNHIVQIRTFHFSQTLFMAKVLDDFLLSEHKQHQSRVVLITDRELVRHYEGFMLKIVQLNGKCLLRDFINS